MRPAGGLRARAALGAAAGAVAAVLIVGIVLGHANRTPTGAEGWLGPSSSPHWLAARWQPALRPI